MPSTSTIAVVDNDRPMREAVLRLLKAGIELQQHLVASGRVVPVVFMTGYGDADARARALELERGGVLCLQKPFSDDALLDAVAKAIGTV